MPRLFLVRFEMILGDFRPGLLNALVGNIYTAYGIVDRLRLSSAQHPPQKNKAASLRSLNHASKFFYQINQQAH